MNKNLLNDGLMTSGIVRAYVIKKDDTRVFVPALLNENIMKNGTLDESQYKSIKQMLPKALFNSKALKNLCTSEPTPCFVTFENGDYSKAIVMGFLGKGVKSVGGGGSSGSYVTNSYIGNNSNIISITGVGNLLLVAGHGNGDPGAIGNGYKEADLTREFVKLLSNKITCDVYDTSKSMYSDLKGSAATQYLRNYKTVIEIHFNATPGGYGTELLVRNTSQPTSTESAVLNAITSVGFRNRGFKDGTWLGNMNKCIKAGVQNYFLVEVCFIDSSSDMNLYQQKKNEIINNLAIVFGGSTPQNSNSASGGTGVGTVDANTSIMGQCVATYNQMITYLRSVNPNAPDYVNLYISEGAAEGVRGDIAFAQSCVETGHWTFTGDVSPNQNNFAGIGTTGGGVKGAYFSTPQIGIRAQIQHLKAYASNQQLNGQLVDPRFNLVTRGCATKIGDFGGGRWASATNYASSIINILNKILSI